MALIEKKEIRGRVRDAYPGDEMRKAQSEAICRRILAWEAYRSADVVAGYVPMRHEADVTPVLLDALSCGKTLVLPRCGKSPLMQFHRVGSLDELETGAYGLMEPSAGAQVIPPEEIGLMLTPLEALTREGLRLGKGGGYYDCWLSRWMGISLGVALRHQWVERLEAQPWDVPLRAAVDCEGIYLFAGKA